jgi:molybdopterin synthase catalytic subunit
MAFNPWEILQTYEMQHVQMGGATACFVGTMRDFNEGDQIRRMWLEHYPEMTTGYLQSLSKEAEQRWQLLDSLIVHRVGEIEIHQSIVLIATWSAHRAAALAACQYLIEALKHTAPFWKKETLITGEQRWVTHNTPA